MRDDGTNWIDDLILAAGLAVVLLAGAALVGFAWRSWGMMR